MPITSTSRFRSVTVVYEQMLAALDYIRVVLADGTEETISLFTPPSDGIYPDPVPADLAQLQALYVSANGLRDGNHVNITPTVEGWTSENILDLEKNGLFNPLDAQSYPRYVANKKRLGAEQRYGAYAESASGLPILTSSLARVPTHFTAQGDQNVSVDDWYAQPSVLSTNFEFVLNIPILDAVTRAGLDSYQPMVAMLKTLNGLRNSGIAIGTDATDPATYSGRTFLYSGVTFAFVAPAIYATGAHDSAFVTRIVLQFSHCQTVI